MADFSEFECIQDISHQIVSFTSDKLDAPGRDFKYSDNQMPSDAKSGGRRGHRSPQLQLMILLFPRVHISE